MVDLCSWLVFVFFSASACILSRTPLLRMLVRADTGLNDPLIPFGTAKWLQALLAHYSNKAVFVPHRFALTRFAASSSLCTAMYSSTFICWGAMPNSCTRFLFTIYFRTRLLRNHICLGTFLLPFSSFTLILWLFLLLLFSQRWPRCSATCHQHHCGISQ